MTAYDFHPFVEIFPPMGRTALLDLAEDIASNGLSTPIVLLTDTADDGESRTRILDGRHRYLACMETRQPEEYLRFVDFTEVAGPDADPLRWVRSQNLSRRHLTRSQRIDAAARWTELFEHRATESRQAAAARTNAQRWGTTPTPAPTPTPPSAPTRSSRSCPWSPPAAPATSQPESSGSPRPPCRPPAGSARRAWRISPTCTGTAGSAPTPQPGSPSCPPRTRPTS